MTAYAGADYEPLCLEMSASAAYVLGKAGIQKRLRLTILNHIKATLFCFGIGITCKDYVHYAIQETKGFWKTMAILARVTLMVNHWIQIIH